MCDSARASRRRYAAAIGLTNSVKPATTRIRTLARRTHVFRLSLACLAVLPWQVQAQEAPGRQEELGLFVLEARIVGGNSVLPTAGASLTFGRRYGARFIFHVGDESSGIVLFQMGGYVSF